MQGVAEPTCLPALPLPTRCCSDDSEGEEVAEPKGSLLPKKKKKGEEQDKGQQQPAKRQKLAAGGSRAEAQVSSHPQVFSPSGPHALTLWHFYPSKPSRPPAHHPSALVPPRL